jgi:hypothetical protein
LTALISSWRLAVQYTKSTKHGSVCRPSSVRLSESDSSDEKAPAPRLRIAASAFLE